jgi:hypothetical protein
MRHRNRTREETTMQLTMRALHEHYVRRVDDAVAADRPDLVADLNDEYLEEALRLILATA